MNSGVRTSASVVAMSCSLRVRGLLDRRAERAGTGPPRTSPYAPTLRLKRFGRVTPRLRSLRARGKPASSRRDAPDGAVTVRRQDGAMPATIIETDGLTKRFGEARGIDDITLAVMPGEVFGFLGPNGAGKTTTIRTLLGLLHPTSGSARLFGLDSQADSAAIRARLGNLPGDFA